MKVLIDIGHPANVHFFAHFAKSLINKRHSVLFTTREKDVTIDLLDYYDLPYVSFGKTKSGLLKKVLWFFLFSFKVLRISLKFRPTVFVAFGGIYYLMPSFLFRKPLISFHNTDASPLLPAYKVFSAAIITPESFTKIMGANHYKISGNFELAFLHPQRFLPDSSVLKRYGVNTNSKLILLRFVSFTAYDDIGKKGINDQEKIAIVEKLQEYGHVIISSEDNLTGDLKQFQLEQNPNYRTGDLQSLEYFADLFLGDSGAMTSECAVLGTPAIYQSNKKLGFIDELVERYNLAYNFYNTKEALEKAVELLNKKDLNAIWSEKRQLFLNQSIDVTGYMVWFVENYPHSKNILKNQPGFTETFKGQVK